MASHVSIECLKDWPQVETVDSEFQPNFSEPNITHTLLLFTTRGRSVLAVMPPKKENVGSLHWDSSKLSDVSFSIADNYNKIQS